MTAMTPSTDLSGFRNKALFIGLAGAAALAAGFASNSDQFFRSYLIGFLYWLIIGVTCNGLLCLHHLVGGRWGVVIRRLLESGSRTLPLNFLFAVPIVLNLHKIYEWTHEEVVKGDKILEHKAAWLNPQFFQLRVVLYFSIWIVMGFLLNRWSREQEEGGGEAAKDKLRALSGPGIVIHVLTLTFASFDFAMSLEPHWYSTIYGILFVVGGALSCMAFLILVLRRLSASEPLAAILKPDHFADLGTIMFAFVVLWAYVSFSQYLIIWSANLPEETPWYVKRTAGTWGFLVTLLMLFHFTAPFFLLLIRFNKRKSAILATIATMMLIMRFVDLTWLVAPAFHEAEQAAQYSIHWMDVTAPIALGGLWVGFFVWQLSRRSLVPLEVARLNLGGHP